MPKILDNILVGFEKDQKDFAYIKLFWEGGNRLINGVDQDGVNIVPRSCQDIDVKTNSTGAADSPDFLARLSLLSADGIFRKGICAFEGFVKAATIKREAENLPDNVDEFFDEARIKTLWLSRLFVGLNAPGIITQGLSVQDLKDLKDSGQELGTQLIAIDPNRVPFWITDERTGEITRILIKEETANLDPFEKKDPVITFLDFKGSTWERLTQEKDGSLARGKVIKHDWGQPPFAVTESIFDILSICRKQREILKRQMIEITNVCRTGIVEYVISNLLDHDDVHVDPGLTTIIGAGKVDTVGVDSDTMEQNRTNLNQARIDLRRSLLLPDEENVNTSGRSKQEDKTTLFSMLIKWAKIWEKKEQFLLGLGFGENVEISYPTTTSDFIVESEEELDMQIKNGIEQGMPKEYIRELQRKQIAKLNVKLSENVDLETKPILNEKRIDIINKAKSLLTDDIISEFLGLEPGQIRETRERELEDNIRRDRALVNFNEISA